MAKTKKHQINPAMHYTVVIALIISLVTTFLLGVLLTETLFGGGLGYFSDVNHEAQVNKKKVDIMRSIEGQLNSQISVDGASAATSIMMQNDTNLDDDFVPLPTPAPDPIKINPGNGKSDVDFTTIMERWLERGPNYQVLYNPNTGFQFVR